jgi:hypothetical protein
VVATVVINCVSQAAQRNKHKKDYNISFPGTYLLSETITSISKGNISSNMGLKCHLGGEVVNVLATGPKGRSDGSLRAIKIRSTLSFGGEVKRESPMS